MKPSTKHEELIIVAAASHSISVDKKCVDAKIGHTPKGLVLLDRTSVIGLLKDQNHSEAEKTGLGRFEQLPKLAWADFGRAALAKNLEMPSRKELVGEGQLGFL